MTARHRPSHRPLWVLKLGGSLACSPLLKHWVEALDASAGRLVVVPGGGPFADEVRAMQRLWAFDDSTAHRLALVAMEQYGVMLSALGRNLRPVASRTAIACALRDGVVPVWLPTQMALGCRDIAESWEVTSDSLAAWLAGRLAATCLVLVKSVAVAPHSTAHDLARQGIVDPALPGFLARAGAECRCVLATDYGEFRSALASGQPPGVFVLHSVKDAGSSVAALG